MNGLFGRFSQGNSMQCGAGFPGGGYGGADHPVFSALDIPLYLEGAQEYNWLNISNSYTRLNIECINKLSAYACFAFPHGAAPRAAERSHSQHTSPQVDFTPSKPSRGGSKQAEEADPHTRQTR